MTSYEKKNDNFNDPKVILKKEFNDMCPYCGSTNVIKVGSSTCGATASFNLPNYVGEDWGCEDCKKIFKLI